MKVVNAYTAQSGRQRRTSCFVVTGNENGIVGMGLARAADPRTAIIKSKKRAASKLMPINLCEDRTVYHDFFTQFGHTKIYGFQMPAGSGVKAHRIIKTICQIVGIKDLSAKVEGSKSPQKIAKAFLIGLLQQKTYQQLAEEKKLFLIEYAGHTSYPRIVGVPSVCRTADQIPKDEILELTQYAMGGKTIVKKPARQSPWAKLPSYLIHLKKEEKRRSWPIIKQDLLVRYGTVRSFLTPIKKHDADKEEEMKNEY